MSSLSAIRLLAGELAPLELALTKAPLSEVLELAVAMAANDSLDSSPVDRGAETVRPEEIAMKKPSEYTTWAQYVEDHASLSSEALELVRKATAPARHAARVAEVTSSIEASTAGTPPYIFNGWSAVLADRVGVGGSPTRNPGAGTARHPLIPSGRKQRQSGAAWDAARDEAYRRAHPGYRPAGFRTPDPETEPGTWLVAVHSDGEEQPLFLDPNDTDLEWAVSVAQQGLLAAAGSPPSDPNEGLPAFVGSLEAWDVAMRAVRALHPAGPFDVYAAPGSNMGRLAEGIESFGQAKRLADENDGIVYGPGRYGSVPVYRSPGAPSPEEQEK